VGSITHCKGFVGAVVARHSCLRAIGFDAELSEPLAADLVPLICTAAETEWIGSTPAPANPGWPKVLFSAKEAVHKCISPLYGIMLDFLDVTLTPGYDKRSLIAHPAFHGSSRGADLEVVQVRLTVTDRFILTAAYVEQTGRE
jgi:4'-phosphopantetheinyl transferase EntD